MLQDDLRVEHVVVANVYGDGNRGGAAITAATIDAVNRAFGHPNIALIPVGAEMPNIADTHDYVSVSYTHLRAHET